MLLGIGWKRTAVNAARTLKRRSGGRASACSSAWLAIHHRPLRPSGKRWVIYSSLQLCDCQYILLSEAIAAVARWGFMTYDPITPTQCSTSVWSRILRFRAVPHLNHRNKCIDLGKLLWYLQRSWRSLILMTPYLLRLATPDLFSHLAFSGWYLIKVK